MLGMPGIDSFHSISHIFAVIWYGSREMLSYRQGFHLECGIAGAVWR